MKLYNVKNLMPALMLVLGLTSCSKYGKEFADGYDDASGNTANITVDTNMQNIDRSAYAKARIFPGLVDLSEPRVQNEEFTLDLNFENQTTQNLRINVAPGPQFSTGYYAAPGELIKIIVPEGANGLSMQIGGHTDNLTGKQPLLRDPIVYAVKPLYPGVNYMRNLYGGTIYIKASFAIAQPVKFVISGACVSPDFVLGKDTDAGWVAKVKASKVPWLEMRTKRVIFLIPRDKVIAKINAGGLLAPTALMTEWNAKFDLDFNGWMGLSDNAPDPKDRSPQGAWRGVLDIQLSVGYGHNGFPFVGLNDNEWFGGMTNLQSLLTSDGMWGTYHEFGHNCQQPSVWSWSTLGETTNNLFNFKAAHRMKANYSILHPNVTTGFPKAIEYASKSGGGKNFDADAVMDDPFMRMTPFVQIFELYGYEAMTVLYKEARHVARLSNNDIDKHDFVYEHWSDYTKTDLLPFFEAWGILTSAQSQTKVAAKYPLLNKAIWTYNPLTKTGGTGSYVPAVSVISVSSPAQEGSFGALIDNDPNTFYHSKYSNPSAAETYPFTFTFGTGGNVAIKGVYFNGRPGANRQGDGKDVEIFTSNDNINYTSRGTTTLPNSNARFEYVFPGGPITTKYVKVVVKNGYTANAYVVFGEMNLLKP